MGSSSLEYNIKKEVETLLSDPTVAKYFGICVALMVYVYCSQYIFFWKGLEDADQDIYDYYQPLLFFTGALVFGTLVSKDFNYKRCFLIVLLGNIIALITSELAIFTNSNTLLFIGQLP